MSDEKSGVVSVHRDEAFFEKVKRDRAEERARKRAELPKCSARVSDTGGWHSHRCGKVAKVERDGKWFCGIHDPVARAEKDQARRDETKRKEDEQSAPARALCAALGCGKPAKSPWLGYTGGVELTPDEARSLIARLAKPER